MISGKSSIKLLLVPLESISELFKVLRTQACDIAAAGPCRLDPHEFFHPSKIHVLSQQLPDCQNWSEVVVYTYLFISPLFGGFLKWWVSPTTMGFPTKNDHFGVWNGGTTIYGNTHLVKMNPFWLAHIFQMGWFNHQLGSDVAFSSIGCAAN